METATALIDSDMVYPILFIPKKCTTLETSCEWTDNVYIEVSITSPDTEGNNSVIYNGFCNVKLVDSYEVNLNRAESAGSEEPDIEKMPVVLSDVNQLVSPPYNQTKDSQVWIDPSRSPYVYNHYDPSSQEQYSIHESGGLITVAQHNTYVTKSVYNCKESDYNDGPSQSPVKDFEYERVRKVQETVMVQPDANIGYYEEDEFECGVFLSQLPEEIMNENQARAREEKKFVNKPSENNALKQLMSSDIQSSSKPRKTILFLGHDSLSGETIQNISYTDPLVKCAATEVDKEVVIGDIVSDSLSPVPNKKRYQCDKCKQIFDQLSLFRLHMVGDHRIPDIKVPTLTKQEVYTCAECGKSVKDPRKFEQHCMAHGDPDLECPKCHKVFASKFSLKVHLKIHYRKYPCDYCIRSYAKFKDLNTHLEKVHSVFLCKNAKCAFTDEDLHWHRKADEDSSDSQVMDAELKLEAERIDQDLMSSEFAQVYDASARQDWAIPSKDLESDLETSRSSEPVPSRNVELETLRNVEPETLRNCDHMEVEASLDQESVTWQRVSDLEALSSQESSSKEPGQTPSSPETEERVLLSARTQQVPAGTGVEEHVPKESEDPEAEDVIAKVMTNSIFLLSTNKAKNHSRKTCEVCLKPFDRVDDLKRHLIEHVIKSTLAKTPISRTGGLAIVCEICQADTFYRVDKYKAHLREHAKLTIYKCTFCDKSFSDSSNFSKHKKIHGIAFYQCDLCQRKFNSKKMIAQHMEHHSKTTPVKCSYCNRMFHFESMLNKHVRAAHKKEETSRCRCRFCDGVFKCLKEKWDHEWNVHSVRKMIADCRICGTRFRKYAELRSHCLHEHSMDIPTARKLLKRRPRVQ